MPSNTPYRWTFTLNNYTEQDLLALTEPKTPFKFIIFGKEVASTGTPHLQGYVEFKHQKSMSAVKKTLGNKQYHLEPAIADAHSNVKYCSKGEQSHEEYLKDGKEGHNYGLNADVYTAGEYKKSGQRTDLESINTLIKTHTIKELIEQGKIKNTQQIGFAQKCIAYNQPIRMTAPRVVWICGDTGTGKTHSIFQKHNKEDIHSQHSFKFWDGYENQPVVLIDDMRADFCKYHELLTLLDKYPHRVEVKCGDRIFNSKTIYITSPYTPQQMFRNKTDEDLVQLTRRIDEIHHIKNKSKLITYPKEEFNKEKKYDNITIIDSKTATAEQIKAFHKQDKGTESINTDIYIDSDSVEYTDGETEYQQGVSPPPSPPIARKKIGTRSSIKWNFEKVQLPVSEYKKASCLKYLKEHPYKTT